jgi:hypothetical protein
VLASFWSGLGSELAKQWVARILTPAFAFWAGGLAAIWWNAHGSGVAAHGWGPELQKTARPLEHLPAVAQGTLVIGALLLIAVSGLAAERLTLPLLRVLEGYWPWWLRRASPSRRRQRREKIRRTQNDLLVRQRRGSLSVEQYIELRRLQAAPAENPTRLAELREARASGFTARDTARLVRARALLRYTPSDDALAMPTRLGDVLRTAERRPRDKYGLDAVVCWTALWLILPTDARTELAQTRGRLDGALRVWLWGALFIVWTPWTLWAIPIAVIVPLVAYYGGMLGSAKLFGDLVVTAYDLYRMDLYDTLHLPRPISPAEERQRGAQLTNLLWGGLDDASVKYVSPPTTS